MVPRIGGVQMSSDAAAEVLRQVERALLEAEPARAVASLAETYIRPGGEQLPRIPVIGLEAGAIRGTSPHRVRI